MRRARILTCRRPTQLLIVVTAYSSEPFAPGCLYLYASALRIFLSCLQFSIVVNSCVGRRINELRNEDEISPHISECGERVFQSCF